MICRPRNADTRGGVFLCAIIVFTALIAVLVLLCSANAAEVPGAASTASIPGAAEVALYMREYLEKTPEPDERHVNVPMLSEIIARQGRNFNIPPLLLAVVLRYESSYLVKPGLGVKGKAGEVGLGQLLGLARTTAGHAGCDLLTVEGQVCGAAAFLRRCLDECDRDELAALRAYQGGNCSAHTAGAFLRYRSYLIAQGLVSEARDVYEKQKKIFGQPGSPAPVDME